LQLEKAFLPRTITVLGEKNMKGIGKADPQITIFGDDFIGTDRLKIPVGTGKPEFFGPIFVDTRDRIELQFPPGKHVVGLNKLKAADPRGQAFDHIQLIQQVPDAQFGQISRVRVPQKATFDADPQFAAAVHVAVRAARLKGIDVGDNFAYWQAGEQRKGWLFSDGKDRTAGSTAGVQVETEVGVVEVLADQAGTFVFVAPTLGAGEIVAQEAVEILFRLATAEQNGPGVAIEHGQSAAAQLRRPAHHAAQSQYTR